jgi:hypothetical protein
MSAALRGMANADAATNAATTSENVFFMRGSPVVLKSPPSIAKVVGLVTFRQEKSEKEANRRGFHRRFAY